MPLSRARDRERWHIRRRGKAALLPRSEARRLKALGLDPVAYFQRRQQRPAPSLDDYRALERALDAKAQRVEWQSGGIAMLRREVATLTAVNETLREALRLDAPATALASRVTLLEAERVLREATGEAQ